MELGPAKTESSGRISQGTDAPITNPPKQMVESAHKVTNLITQKGLSPGTGSSDTNSLATESDDSIASKRTGTLEEQREANIKKKEKARTQKELERHAPKTLPETGTLSAQAEKAIDKRAKYLQEKGFIPMDRTLKKGENEEGLDERVAFPQKTKPTTVKKGNSKEISPTNSATKKQNNSSLLSRISNLFTRSLPTQKPSSVVPLNLSATKDISRE